MKSSAIPELLVRRVARLLLERVGLRPSAEGDGALRLALLARLDALGEQDPMVYLQRFESGEEEAELRALLPLVTVGKTEFFRDSNQFRALRTNVVPELLGRVRRERRRLQIWSAGCATGEEPYSLAMLASDLGLRSDDVDLLATDVNHSAVERAQAGRFPARRFANVPPEYLQRHFVEKGDHFEAAPQLRRYVRFDTHNLASDAYPRPLAGGCWDLILCRNVIIYFDAPTTAKVVRRFHDGLHEGAFLCLGYSESLYKISADFELVEFDSAFLYRKPVGPLRPRVSEPARLEAVIAKLREAVELRKQMAKPAGPAGPAGPAAAARAVAPPRPVARAPEPVVEEPAAPPPAMPAERPRTPSGELAMGFDPVEVVARVLDAGEFDRALKLLRTALERTPANLALQITLGNVLTVMGEHDEAMAAYRGALLAEPLCLEAHLFLGIACYEAGRDFDAEAEQELGRALFLDPNLGLAHYYAGRLAERSGDHVAARRAYRNAVAACRGRGARTSLLGHFPDLPSDPAVLARAAQYALAAIEEL